MHPGKFKYYMHSGIFKYQMHSGKLKYQMIFWKFQYQMHSGKLKYQMHSGKFQSQMQYFIIYKVSKNIWRADLSTVFRLIYNQILQYQLTLVLLIQMQILNRVPTTYFLDNLHWVRYSQNQEVVTVVVIIWQLRVRIPLG